MHVFHKGAKAFDFFLSKDFRYDLKNALRIMNEMTETDRKRYNFDASRCNWVELLDRMMLGIRRFYFKEKPVVKPWHRIYNIV